MNAKSAPEMGRKTVYEHLRPLLFSIAYRMVGSAGDAEDIVQEAFLRFHRESSNGTEIESPKAWLSTVTTRLAINHAQSARVRRESYVGTWLPEPLLTDTESDGARQVETADSLSLAFLVLLESLGPVERAVFLLREVFGYGYDEIAGVVGRSEDNCRQIAVRARRQVDAKRPRFEASRKKREELSAVLRCGLGRRRGGTDSFARRRRRRLRRWWWQGRRASPCDIWTREGRASARERLASSPVQPAPRRGQRAAGSAVT